MARYVQYAMTKPVSSNQDAHTGDPGFYFKGGRIWVCVHDDRSKLVLWQSDWLDFFYLVGYFPFPCPEYNRLLDEYESAFVAASGRATKRFYRQFFRKMYGPG